MRIPRRLSILSFVLALAACDGGMLPELLTGACDFGLQHCMLFTGKVNKREADQIVVALRDRGFPVEYIVAPDEGHGFARPVNRMAMLVLAEKFLAKYLGGRYQESHTPEVAKRLQEITVDPKAVKLTNPSDK